MAIEINVVNKIATTVGAPVIVCGNSDYTVLFSFDEEWDAHDLKTARFCFRNDKGKKCYEVPFRGNECAVPKLSNITEVNVGVYAGDLCTTTPAVVACRKSILCGGEAHAKPQEDIYQQLLGALDVVVTATIEDGVLVLKK